MYSGRKIGAMDFKDLLYVGEYIKDRLYFATVRDGVVPVSRGKYHYFSIDDTLVYENFYFDFGPLNLSMLYRYCTTLTKMMDLYSDKIIIHYTTFNEKKRSNAAFLVASFAMIYLNKNVEEAYAPLIGKNIPSYLPFRDATTTEPTITLSIKDCLQGIYRAHALGFFRFDDFNLAEYENYERVEEGDMNWIIPQKFLAFSGPHSHVDKANSQEHAPEYYFSYFKQNGITNIIRLNKKSYDANRFVDSGFQHNDLYFHDGSTPSNLILDKFFKITENAPGAVAVHCKAGLGRTGSVIACYLMKHYRFNVGEAIAWVRICRPGSIIGIQQKWLHDKKTQLWIEGNRYRKKKYGSANFIPTHKYGIYSNEIHLMRRGEEPLREFLYEPTVLKKTDLSDIVHTIGAINLEDKDEAFKTRVSIHDQNYEKKKVELTSAIRNSRSRTNASQGDKLYQIKASRKQPRSLSTPLMPVGVKPRILCTKSKHTPSIYDLPVAKPMLSKPTPSIYDLPVAKPLSFHRQSNFYSEFPTEHTNGYQTGSYVRRAN